MTIERGGFGADTAAPAARQILDELLDVDEAQIDEVEAERRWSSEAERAKPSAPL